MALEGADHLFELITDVQPAQETQHEQWIAVLEAIHSTLSTDEVSQLHLEPHEACIHANFDEKGSFKQPTSSNQTQMHFKDNGCAG